MDFSEVVLRKISEVAPSVYASFKCTRQELTEFLLVDALAFEELQLSITYLFMDKDEKQVLGYFSLAADAIRLNDSEQFEIGASEIEFKTWPAVKLTKLAVSSQLMGQGVGSEIMQFVVGLVYDSAMACRFITTDAVNDEGVLKFYEKQGFVASLHAESQYKDKALRENILMFKDILAHF